MASRCNRFMSKPSISSLKSAFKSTYIPKSAPSSPKSPLPTRSTASPLSRFFMSSSCSKNDVLPEHQFKELQSSFTGVKRHVYRVDKFRYKYYRTHIRVRSSVAARVQTVAHLLKNPSSQNKWHMSFPVLETDELGFARPVIIPNEYDGT